MGNFVYNDGTYKVTEAIVATPHRFYPVANTTARIRRDPLWVSLFITALGVAAFHVYGDLIYTGEKIVLGVICAGALAVGQGVSILSIDAVGHRRALIVARTTRIRRLYAAIRAVRVVDGAAGLGHTSIFPER